MRATLTLAAGLFLANATWGQSREFRAEDVSTNGTSIHIRVGGEGKSIVDHDDGSGIPGGEVKSATAGALRQAPSAALAATVDISALQRADRRR